MHKSWKRFYYVTFLKPFAHFGNHCQWGRSFGGLYGIGFVLWFILKYLPSLPLHSLLGFIYIVETPPSVMVDNICNEFMFIHTCINYGGVCSIYVDGLTSHTFVVFDVSATILVR